MGPKVTICGCGAATARKRSAAGKGNGPTRALAVNTNKGCEGPAMTVQMINTLPQQAHTSLKSFGMDRRSRSRVTVSNNTGQQTLPGVDEQQGSPASQLHEVEATQSVARFFLITTFRKATP